MLDVVKETGNQVSPADINVTKKTDGSYTYNEYSISYTQENKDDVYYVGYYLDVPQELIKLDRKFRVTFVTRAGDIVARDREFWLTTNKKKYGVVIKDNADGLVNTGNYIVKDFVNNDVQKYEEADFVDDLLSTNYISVYALEIVGGNI